MMQKDIASYLNISASAYGFYEQGKRMPTFDVLSNLADYFEVSVDYLLGKSDIRSVPQYESINTYKETDIEKLTDELLKQDGLMFNGEALNDEDLHLLKNSMKSTLEFLQSVKNKKK